MPTIDINCDLGEGAGTDEQIMPYISSANIACGFHAGDEKMMNETIQLAITHKVAIGAHPSFFDRDNFGRTEMNLLPDDVYDLILLQLRQFEKIVRQHGASLHHVKPHGAAARSSRSYCESRKRFR